MRYILSYKSRGVSFPTNIVINFKSDGRLNFDATARFGDTATGMLSLPGLYGSAWIIDGQHRLYGYSYSQRPKEEDRSVISVLAYENLSTQEEIELFIDINSKQVKVNRNLVNEIISSLRIDDPDPRESLPALRARISLALDEFPQSPLRARVVTVAQDKTSFRCITLTSIADGLDEAGLIGTIHRSGGATSVLPGPLAHVSGGPLKTLAKATEALSSFFGLFAHTLDEHWKLGDAKGGYLCTNNGARALLLLFGEIARFVEHRDGVKFLVMDPESIVAKVAPMVAPLIEYFANASPSDISAFRTRGSSLQSVADNNLHMMSVIYEADQNFKIPKVVEFMESRDTEGTTLAKQLIDEINTIVYKDVLETLQKHYGTVKDAWWVKGVPPGVRDSADQNFNKNNGEFDRWQYLFFIDYASIVVYGENWELFKDYYNFYGKGKTPTLVRWIGHVNKARTVTHHAEKGPLSRAQVEFVKHVHQLVKDHIEHRVKVIEGHRYIAED